jgi:hypothetical protein
MSGSVRRGLHDLFRATVARNGVQVEVRGAPASDAEAIGVDILEGLEEVTGGSRRSRARSSGGTART